MDECLTTAPASAPAMSMLTTQHREVERLWAEVESEERQDADRQRSFAELVRLLCQHDTLELQVIYPELRTVGGDTGRRLADESADEHRTIREVLTLVDGRDLSDPVVFTALSHCMTHVMHHIDVEERHLYPCLLECSSADRLAELGDRMQELLAVAPTHPGVRSRLRSGLVDRARRALRERG